MQGISSSRCHVAQQATGFLVSEVPPLTLRRPVPVAGLSKIKVGMNNTPTVHIRQVECKAQAP